MIRTPRLTRATSRTALLFGFSAILVVLVLAGLYSLRVLRDAQAVTESRNREVFLAGQTLDSLRFTVLAAGTYLRDYLLEPDPKEAEESLDSLRGMRTRVQETLASYGRQVQPEDREVARALERSVNEFWKLIDPVLQWDHPRRQREGFAYLKGVVFPKRTEVLELTTKLARLNEDRLREADQRFLGMFRLFRTRLNAMLFGTVLLGLVLGLVTSVYILQLERNLEAQYNEISRAREQLEDLSAGMVEAQEEERKSLARELHDEVGQSLSAILMDTARASSSAPDKDQELQQTLGGIKRSAESVLQKVRDLSLLLRPSMLDDFGLLPALHWQAREFFRRYGIDAKVTAEETSEDLPDVVKTCVYRIVQEALNNVARHSGAREVKILLRRDERRLLVVVQDDGHGFESRLVRGLGLLGMEERARRLRGIFRVESAPGKGTVLQIELPIVEDAKEEDRKLEVEA